MRRLGSPGRPGSRPVAGTDEPLVVEALRDRDDAGPGAEVVFARPRVRRTRTVVGGVVAVAAAAVVASVVVGGSGPGRAAPTTTAAGVATTTAAGVATTTAAGVATTTAAGASPTSGPSPRSFASTAPATPPSTAASIRIGGGPLLGRRTGLVLYAVVSGRLMRIDLDAAAITVVPVGDAFNDNTALSSSTIGPVLQSHSGRLWVLGAGDVLTPLSDGSAAFLGEGPAGRLWFTENGSVWFRDGVDHPAISLEEPPAGIGPAPLADGLGGVLVGAGGGVYRLVPDRPPERLGAGELIDAANGFTLEEACDEALRCGAVVRDLRTGAVRSAPGLDVLRDDANGRLSPDGAWVLRGGRPDAADSDADRVVLVGPDGATVELGGLPNGGCVARYCPVRASWSPDGAWLIGVRSATELWAWTPGAAAPIVLQAPETVAGLLLSFNGPVAVVPG